jgi:CheY-like chemotaxis protein
LLSKLLFVDDEPENLRFAIEILQEALPDSVIILTETVDDTIKQLSNNAFDLVVMDIFIPMGKNLHQTLGPRGKKYEENLRHLGGLAILDFVEKMSVKPKILAHTACTDYALIEVLGDIVVDRIPKPAAVDILLTEVRRHLGLLP